MTKKTKTCTVDGVTYCAHPQPDADTSLDTLANLGLCQGCVAHPPGRHDSELCNSLDDCVRDNIIWVVKQ